MLEIIKDNDIHYQLPINVKIITNGFRWSGNNGLRTFGRLRFFLNGFVVGNFFFFLDLMEHQWFVLLQSV